MEADEIVNTIRTLALSSYLKARQADDIRHDLAASLKFTSGPYVPGDKVWYYAIDENKLKRGKKYGRWWKAEVVGNKRSMVIIDLGTKIISVNQSLLRKDHDLLGDRNPSTSRTC